MNPAAASDDTIVEEVTINAPAERIFSALTNPDELLKWWAAEGHFHATHVETAPRPGRQMADARQQRSRDIGVKGDGAGRVSHSRASVLACLHLADCKIDHSPLQERCQLFAMRVRTECHETPTPSKLVPLSLTPVILTIPSFLISPSSSSRYACFLEEVSLAPGLP